MERFCKIEKFLIANVDDNYTTYRCDEHGVFQKRKDIDDGCCIYCKKKYNPIENITELKEKFKKELNIK